VGANPIQVLQYGLGPIGAAALRIVAERPALHVVGAVDVDPDKVGRDVGEVVGLGRALIVRVDGNAAQALQRLRPDVVVHCTGSSLEAVMPQLREIVVAGASIVSTCEELSYPWARQEALAAELDALARERGVAVLGTGVNPGFVMDLLPLVLSGVTSGVRAIHVRRVVDASARRGPLQRKIGAGITPADFTQRADRGALGHVGLRESLHMLAAGLGWEMRDITDTLEPVLAETEITTAHVRVRRGNVAGVHEVARGTTLSGKSVELDLAMYVGAPDPRDEVVIDGEPRIHMVIHGGIFGDTATAAIAANAIPVVRTATPGLRTMYELPPVTPHQDP